MVKTYIDADPGLWHNKRSWIPHELLLPRGGYVNLKRLVVSGILGSLALVMVAAPTAIACVTSSWITTDPSSGPPGTRVTVTGAGFEPGTVMFRWDRSAESGGEVLGQATVGEDGRVVAEVTVPEASSGSHKVIAEHTSSSETVAHADAWSDFEVPGAAPEKNSEAGSEDTAQGSSRSSDSTPATGRQQMPEPAVQPGSGAGEVAQPASQTPTIVEARKTEAVRDERRSLQVPAPQLAQRLRAVDMATYPLVMEDVAPVIDGASRAPGATESAGWEDLRWIAAAVAAMTAGLFALARRKRRTPEPERAVFEFSPNAMQQEEADRAA